MSTKGMMRYAIAFVFLCILLSVALPFAGIPRSAIMPPPFAYAQAGGTTMGYTYERDTSPTANLFHVGDLNYYVSYRYKAPALPPLGQHVVAPNATTVYKAHALVDRSFYDAYVLGQAVPVKYDVNNPAISGITSPGGGRNVADEGSLLGWWILWDVGILVVSYPLQMLLERIILRESY